MDKDKAAYFQERLKILKQQYGLQLEGWHKKLVSLNNSIDSWGRSEKETLRGIAHNLAGTGGTFNFDEITTLGREVEKQIIQEPQSKEDYKSIKTNLTALIASCEFAIAEIKNS